MQRKPSLLDPASWPYAEERYGRSPAMQALDDLRAWDALPPDVKAKAAAHFVRQRIEQTGE